jgi:hypothetical protein
MLTIACVYNSQISTKGPQYNEDWVDKLYRAVNRNIDIPFKFVCLSNVTTKYDTVPLSLNLNGYWNKVELFRKDLFSGPVLYLDLDVVICKNITVPLQELPLDKFLMLQEPYRDIINSSVMYWSGDYSHLYNDFNTHIPNKYDDINRPGSLGDQAYIAENVEYDIIENYTMQGFIGWRHHKVETSAVEPSLLIFTSTEKPSNNTKLELVKQNWI